MKTSRQLVKGYYNYQNLIKQNNKVHIIKFIKRHGRLAPCVSCLRTIKCAANNNNYYIDIYNNKMLVPNKKMYLFYV